MPIAPARCTRETAAGRRLLETGVLNLNTGESVTSTKRDRTAKLPPTPRLTRKPEASDRRACDLWRRMVAFR